MYHNNIFHFIEDDDIRHDSSNDIIFL